MHKNGLTDDRQPRLVFFYGKKDRTMDVHHFLGDGYFLLFHRLIEARIISSAYIVMEGSPVSGHSLLAQGILWREVSRKEDVSIETTGTIVWVRGASKPTDYYEELRGRGIPIIFYGANTGRERWPFWSIILDDLGRMSNGQPLTDDRGTVWVPWVKPINEEIFFPHADKRPPWYDVCVGASFIHDKKGQWMALEALRRLQNDGLPLRVVVPGAVRHGKMTDELLVNAEGLRATMCGQLTRQQLAEVFRRSRLFIHCGSGQNDRGLLEAMACGCFPIITQPLHHPIFTHCYQSSEHSVEALMIEIIARLEYPQFYPDAYKQYLCYGSMRHSVGTTKRGIELCVR